MKVFRVGVDARLLSISQYDGTFFQVEIFDLTNG